MGPTASHGWLDRGGIERWHWEAVDDCGIPCAFHALLLAVCIGKQGPVGGLGFLGTIFLEPEGEWRCCTCSCRPPGSRPSPRSCRCNWVSQLPGGEFSGCESKMKVETVGSNSLIPEPWLSVPSGRLFPGREQSLGLERPGIRDGPWRLCVPDGRETPRWVWFIYKLGRTSLVCATA